MPIVTALKPQKKKNRVNVYVDYEFAFGIDLDNLVRYGIKIDREFSTDELNKIIHEAEFQKTYDKLLRFAMLRPRSEKEVTSWFRRKEVAPKLQPKLIKKLKYLDLLDDKKFAQWWVGQRIEFKKKGKRVLQMELKQKGIADEIIREVLEESDIDETKLAKQLLAKKIYKWEKLPEKEKNQKIAQFLLRNGFGWDVVRNLTHEGETE